MIIIVGSIYRLQLLQYIKELILTVNCTVYYFLFSVSVSGCRALFICLYQWQFSSDRKSVIEFTHWPQTEQEWIEIVRQHRWMMDRSICHYENRQYLSLKIEFLRWIDSFRWTSWEKMCQLNGWCTYRLQYIVDRVALLTKVLVRTYDLHTYNSNNNRFDQKQWTLIQYFPFSCLLKWPLKKCVM